jgi:hypothetical protein
VLAEIHEPFIADYNAQYATDFTVNEITDWEFGQISDHFADRTGHDTFTDFLTGPDDTDVDEFLPMTAAYWEDYVDPDAPDRLAPVEDNIGQYVSDIHDALDAAYEDYQVDIVTARTGLEAEMQTWLQDHGIAQGEAYNEFVVAQDKHERPYTDYIDDNPRLAAALAEEQYVDNRLFLFDRPYNQDVDTTNHVRIDSLADVASQI